MAENCIIILNYNDSERVIGLVRHIAGYNSLQHIVIVDNCSTDSSYENLQKLKNEKIQVIRTKENRGYATGNNFGAKYAIEKWDVKTLFFANPDVLFEENIINLVENTLYSHKNYGLATVLEKKGHNVWNLPAYWGTVRMLFMLSFTLHKYNIRKKMLQTAGVHEAGVVEGSFFAIKASVFDEIGGFDERTFLYLEENILAYKLRYYGYKIIINCDGIYLHEHSKSISKAYKSKANAFKLFLPSFTIYLKYYLKCGIIKMALFYFFYALAYYERVIYDIAKRIDEMIKGI